ncbi:hypothetical protein NliqN6_0735 [Naganishia liquefaciens]|uniref:Large ribosomal subunit protein uL4m n=1 Tax=Naganishia liquefaciens TaxID=104408 RepID=A0A8H3TP30_9TREE|nr:hypothetical protein NliqN6_0735 [Naganishia liquefaciens]
MKHIISTLSPAFSALGRRTFATAIPHTAAQEAQRATHAPSIVTAQPEANIGIAEEDLPTNLVYEDVEGPLGEGEMVDVTEDVLRMLERDNAFASSSKMLQYADPTFLPLSSLRDINPTLPASEGLAVPLPPVVFQQPLRRDILHRCVVYYRSLLRQGTASTKTRADVNRSGRKLYRQKGTGKARVGSAGSGTRRGGGTIHGPHPRDFAQALPRKVQHLGLHVALSSKLQSGLLRVIQDYGEADWSGTRDASIALSDENPVAFKARQESAKGMLEERFEADESASPTAQETVETMSSSLIKFGPRDDLSITFVHGPATEIATLEKIDRCLRNIPGIDILPVEDLAAYEVLLRKWIVMDVSAVEWLAARAGQSELLDSAESVEGESAEGRFEEVNASEGSPTQPPVNA